jgi:DNA adenine methylase
MPDPASMKPKAPTRPVLRYHGGKWRIAPWIVAHFPPHRVYVEPFGGAASVLLRKPPAQVEVYNDLDEEVVNVFRVLRDPATAAELERVLRLTPYSRAEWSATYGPADPDTPVERARRLIVRAFLGHGTKGPVSPNRTGFHTALSDAAGYTRVTSWNRMPDSVLIVTERLRSVLIEECDGVEVSRRFDAPDALHYVDPPYLGYHQHYRVPFTRADHERLADHLHALHGTVVLSGYPHPVLDALYAGWRRVERPHAAFGAAARTEVLWIKPSGVLRQARAAAQAEMALA